MNREDMIRDIEERYRLTGRSFNERERRHWAATEAIKLGRGGITIVSKALRISPNTIKKGIQEIATGGVVAPSQANSRIRKPGGGRKSKETSLHRATRTRSREDLMAIEQESRASDGFVANRSDAPTISAELDSVQANDNESVQRLNQPEVL